MSLSLSIGDADPFSLSGLKDLAGAAKNINFKLGTEFSAFMEQPLSALPAHFSSTDVQYGSDAGSWTPGLGAVSPITFTLSGGAGGKVWVVSSGDLLTYTDTLPRLVTTGTGPGVGTPVPAPASGKIPVQAGDAFLAIKLDFSVSGGASGSFQQGVYGVSANGSASSTVSVSFYKSCAPSTPLRDALQQAFQAFVLPLHEKTLEQMSPGDYLHYRFNGNLQLGVGARLGYEKVLYAGTAVQVLPNTASAFTVSGAIRPTVDAGVKFSFAYDYSGSFEVMLWSDPTKQAHLHLYRSQAQDKTFGMSGGISLSTKGAASGGVTTPQVVDLFSSSLPGLLQKGVSAGVSAVQGEAQKYVKEVNDKVSAWLTRTEAGDASLSSAIEHTQSTFLLTDYTIDLTNPNHTAAWVLMLKGQFLEAMETPGSGVTLATGSGVERLFTESTAIKLNLFGAVQAAWTKSTFNNSSLVYAGNSVFHVIATEGEEVLATTKATEQELTMYFAAEADLSTGGSRVKAPKLHCLLQAENKPGFGKVIGDLLRRLAAGQEIATLADAVTATAAQPNSTVTLHLIFGPDAYAGLDASVMRAHKPDDEAKDARNYAAFANACKQTCTDEPASLQWDGRPLPYELWRDAWIAADDGWPASPGSVPDRRAPRVFNDGVAQMLSGSFAEFSAPGSMGPRMIFYAFVAAAQFMNLSDDLKILASQTTVYTPATWTSFVAELAHIVHNDLSKDFIPATMLALAELCGGTPSSVSGPVAGLPVGRSLGVTMTYGQPD